MGFNRAMDIHPNQGRLDEALRLADAGEAVPAFNIFFPMIEQGEDPPGATGAFGWFLARQMPAADHRTLNLAYEMALTRCWVRPEILVPAVMRQLAARHAGALGGQAGAAEVRALLLDPQLLALMGATPAATPGLELLLARFRHGALLQAAAGQPIGGELATLAAMAVRAARSGYAMTLPAGEQHRQDRIDEIGLRTRLRAIIAAADQADPLYVTALTVLACYEPPAEEMMALGRAAGQPMAALLDQWVVAPRARRAALVDEVPALTGLDDASRDLAAQYEAQPYPAWGCEPADPVAVPDAVLAAVGGHAGPKSVLIAGCGTGQQAVAAAHTWKGADILAVDISRASLAYAIDKAREAGVSRISFAQADIMALDRPHGDRFDLIEAMGVLHHLADPAAGLRNLAGLLAPGGVIGIALYSAAARANLRALRTRYGRAAQSDDEIRDFRAWALAEAAGHPFLSSPDFYSVGGVRDALFNVREQSFDLDGVAALLDQAGLALVAVQPPPRAGELLGEVPDATDLAGWARAEQARPELFTAMVEVWARAAG